MPVARLEFTVPGPPVSAQTKNRRRLQSWKTAVAAAAQVVLGAGQSPSTLTCCITITYYYDGESPDVDNIIKPIQDALIGLAYEDDGQVIETKSRKRSIDASYQIRGVSATLLAAFADGTPFLHIVVDEAHATEVLD